MDINRLKKIIAKQLIGECSEDEKAELENWLAETEENRKLMNRLRSGEFLKQAVGDENLQLRLQSWNRIESQTTGSKRTLQLRWLRTIAAVVVLGMLGSSLWLIKKQQETTSLLEVAEQIHAGTSKAIVELANGQQIFLSRDTFLSLVDQGIHLINTKDTLNIIGTPSMPAGKTEYHVIRIPRGGEYIARLEDGSVVHLNAGSELKIPVSFEKDSRDVWLKGEAFFDVTPDKNRLFTVHTEKAKISVLGTEFDVRAYEDEKEVITTLVTGMVEVCSGAVADRLSPGEQARVEPGKISTGKVDVYPYIAWKTGRMFFEDAPLEQIMTELQRWYDFEIFYANPNVKEMRFTIDILKYDDISKVLNLMEKMEKVTFTQNGRTVVLSNR